MLTFDGFVPGAPQILLSLCSDVKAFARVLDSAASRPDIALFSDRHRKTFFWRSCVCYFFPKENHKLAEYYTVDLEPFSKISFGLPPLSAGLVPRFKSSTYNSMPAVLNSAPSRS